MSTNTIETTFKGEGIYNTEPYHLEKYVVPGAVAVTFLFIFPWYILGGSALGGADLGTTIIATLAVGHLIESLKVYQWGRKVRENFRIFNAQVQGLLAADGIEEKELDQAKAVLFSQLNTSEGSGFAWNLVRWQKMTVFAVLLFLSSIQWFLFGILAILECKELNPFTPTFQIVALKEVAPPWSSVVSEVILATAMFLTAWYVYKYGLDRQIRNNGFFFQLFLKYREQIVNQLKIQDSDAENQT